MKQKDQAKQNTKKELKETPNWTSSAKTVAPDAPVMSKGSIGATTMLLLREHVKWPASKPSEPDTPVVLL